MSESGSTRESRIVQHLNTIFFFRVTRSDIEPPNNNKLKTEPLSHTVLRNQHYLKPAMTSKEWWRARQQAGCPMPPRRHCGQKRVGWSLQHRAVHELGRVGRSTYRRWLMTRVLSLNQFKRGQAAMQMQAIQGHLKLLALRFHIK